MASRQLAVVDLETDPFLYGRTPKAFVSGIKIGDRFISFWGLDCVQRTVDYLESLPEPLIIYWHNGGKFDVWYFLKHLHADLKIINGRIIQCHIGKHEFRDSFCILPFALKQYKKDDIDYTKMESEVRELHREEILDYLQGDCEYLLELVEGFHAEFGDNLTIGGTAMKELKKFHQFRQSNDVFDAKIRIPFYYGGRVECFASGLIHEPVKVYDANSAYPNAMKRYLHPVGTNRLINKRIMPNTCFVEFTGWNYGALPSRVKGKGLDFNREYGSFNTTIHEFEAAIATGTIRVERIDKTIGFDDRISFEEFVDSFYVARQRAKAQGDSMRALFYKFVLNSAYGKFATNPENFHEWQITGLESQPEPWAPAHIGYTEGFGQYIIWRKPAIRKNYLNVAVGASITGAARAELLHALCKADTPYYCDTDSIMCKDMPIANQSETELGGWKLEASGDALAIAGKKMYALFSSDDANISDDKIMLGGKAHYCIKKASKGVPGSLTSGQKIASAAMGSNFKIQNPAPSFKWGGTAVFTEREVRNTA